jgi:UrcA family protein
MFIKSMLTAMAAVAALGLAGSAAAQTSSSDPGSVSRRISFADLNLANQAGAKAMLRRIRFAAGDVCVRTQDDLLDLYAQYNACVKTATNRAVERLGNPLVTALNGGGERFAAAGTVTPRS